MRIHVPSLLLGLLATSSLLLVVSARSQEVQPPANQEAVLLKTLDALAQAQTRQAVAWEQLAAKGWPTPQNVTLQGGIPNLITLDLTGSLSVSQNGSWSITRY